MSGYIKVLGRAAGKALRSQVVDRTISAAAGYVLSEMRLVDVRARRMFLRKKRDNHLNILGRTWYRLNDNDIDPMTDERIQVIVRVLMEIDGEIDAVSEELVRRKEYESERRKADKAFSENDDSHRSGPSGHGGGGRR